MSREGLAVTLGEKDVGRTPTQGKMPWPRCTNLKCMAKNRHICCMIVGGKPNNALPISCDPIVADEEETAYGFLGSRAGWSSRMKPTRASCCPVGTPRRGPDRYAPRASAGMRPSCH